MSTRDNKRLVSCHPRFCMIINSSFKANVAQKRVTFKQCFNIVLIVIYQYLGQLLALYVSLAVVLSESTIMLYDMI